MLRLAEEAKRRRTRGAKDTDGPIDCLAVCACSAESVAWVFHPGSTMSEAVRDFDWASTALGPMTSWCASWLMAVSIMLASHFPIACWLGPDFHLLYNDAYLPILASKHPRALGKPGREIWYDIWHVIEAQHHSVRTSGRSSWAEDQMLIVNRNGYEEEVYFTYSYSPIRSPSGQVVGTFNAAEETTARFIAERRLESLRSVSVRTARANSPEAVMRECAAAVEANARDFPFVLFYTAEEGGDKTQRLVAQLRVTSGAPQTAEEVTADGMGPMMREVAVPSTLGLSDALSVAPTTAVLLPLCQSAAGDANAASAGTDTLLGVLVIGVNPHKRPDEAYRTFLKLLSSTMCAALLEARNQARERRKAEQLAELDRMKTAFFHNISHELRTPLTLMIGPLDDVMRTELDPAQREAVDCALRNSRRLLRLVNMLLSFARIEAGREKAVYRPTDLAGIVADVASNFRSACARGGLDLAVDCTPLDEPVYLDRDMLEKITLNLLSNAFKFTLRGGIRVSVKRAGQYALLTVADTGCGIPQTEIPRIFDRFHRVGSAHGRTHEGTGIGLALVSELVQLHGGTVEVRSEVGVGSVFTVRLRFGYAHLPPEQVNNKSLPVAQSVYMPLDWWSDGSPAPSPRSIVVRSSKRSATAGARVLVVDDNADMRGYLTRVLTESAYTVFSASDGIEALEKLREKAEEGAAIDLVISDVMMPRMDGHALLQAMRGVGGDGASNDKVAAVLKETPVVVLSARAAEEEVGEGVTLGADDYLVKPFSARELLTRVAARIELRRVRAAAVRREQELREAAERADAAKERFIAVLSHELRTPLTPALMIAEAGEADETLSETVRRDMGIVASNIRLEVHLIADLLDITKIRQGKLELHIEAKVDTHALLRQTLSMLSESTRQRAHHVHVSLDCEPCVVAGDSTRLQQVFWNIIGNAIKFTPDGGQIWVSTTYDEGFLVLRVRDTGLGIDASALPRLFCPFEQGSGAVTRQFGGLGLGLAITKQLVALHRGTVEASSEGPHKGALFTVRIPLAGRGALTSPGCVATANGESSVSPPRPPSARELRVLVVEDNVSTQAVLARMLQRMRHRTRVAGTVREAIAALKAETFDALLCDLGLTDGSGVEVMESARTLQPRLYAAALTGYGTEADVERTRAAGFAAHFVKPIRLAQLQEFGAAAAAQLMMIG